MSILILILEILFYSLFMKFAKKDENLSKYTLVYTLCTIITLILRSNNFLTYLIFIFGALIFTKYLTKSKTDFYDMFLIVSMLFFKLAIEYTNVLFFYNLLGYSILTTTIIFTICKFGLLFLLKNDIRHFYRLTQKMWNKNNFYIRYIFSILMFSYTIVTVITILFY